MANAENFVESLKVMGYGMLGIFVVAAVLVLIMVLLTKLFPAKKEEKAAEENREQ